MANFEDSIVLLVDLGLYDVVLPFILVFTVVYAILEKSSVFGKDNKKINAMVAFILGFISVASLSFVSTVQDVLPYTALFIVMAVLALIVLGVFGIKASSSNSWIRTLSIIFSLVGVLLIFGIATDLFEKIKLPWEIVRAVSGFVLIAAFFVIVIWWIVKDSPSKAKENKKISENELSSP